MDNQCGADVKLLYRLEVDSRAWIKYSRLRGIPLPVMDRVLMTLDTADEPYAVSASQIQNLLWAFEEDYAIGS